MVATVLTIFGLMFGSFAGAQVWRIRSRQLVEDKEGGEEVDKKEYKTLLPLSNKKLSSDRSLCLHCGVTLKWYDLIPLVSWASTGGKCRYCKKSIGRFEPTIELGTAAAFVVSFIFWPQSLTGVLGIGIFLLWLAAIICLAILFAYDSKWFLLPDVVVLPLIGIGLLMFLLRLTSGFDEIVMLTISQIGAITILSGLYYLLWYISKEQWVGFGDVKLGLGLALLVGDWRLALLTLFLANLIGSIVVLPGLVLGKVNRKAHVPFGPLLILGAGLAMLFGERMIHFYLQITF